MKPTSSEFLWLQEILYVAVRLGSRVLFPLSLIDLGWVTQPR